MAKWKVKYTRDNGTSNEITVKGENEGIARQNASNWLATNESANCHIQTVTEKKED